MVTISAAAREYGLSRGTLLHYDAIGLLKPSLRSDTRYRLYSEADLDRLGQICRYREAGLKLGDIRALLDQGTAGSGTCVAVLERRLGELSDEIAQLRAQQHLILRILKGQRKRDGVEVVNKEQWVALLEAAGMDEAGMRAWHCAFERLSGTAHRDFLRSLNIPDDEVRQIRAWSRKGA